MKRRAGFLSVWRTGLGAAAFTCLPGTAEVPLPPTASRDVQILLQSLAMQWFTCGLVLHFMANIQNRHVLLLKRTNNTSESIYSNRKKLLCHSKEAVLGRAGCTVLTGSRFCQLLNCLYLAWERTRRDRGKWSLQQYFGWSLGDNREHSSLEEKQNTQWETGEFCSVVARGP